MTTTTATAELTPSDRLERGLCRTWQDAFKALRDALLRQIREALASPSQRHRVADLNRELNECDRARNILGHHTAKGERAGCWHEETDFPSALRALRDAGLEHHAGAVESGDYRTLAV